MNSSDRFGSGSHRRRGSPALTSSLSAFSSTDDATSDDQDPRLAARNDDSDAEPDEEPDEELDAEPDEDHLDAPPDFLPCLIVLVSRALRLFLAYCGFVLLLWTLSNARRWTGTFTATLSLSDPPLPAPPCHVQNNTNLIVPCTLLADVTRYLHALTPRVPEAAALLWFQGIDWEDIPDPYELVPLNSSPLSFGQTYDIYWSVRHIYTAYRAHVDANLPKRGTEHYNNVRERHIYDPTEFHGSLWENFYRKKRHWVAHYWACTLTRQRWSWYSCLMCMMNRLDHGPHLESNIIAKVISETELFMFTMPRAALEYQIEHSLQKLHADTHQFLRKLYGKLDIIAAAMDTIPEPQLTEYRDQLHDVWSILRRMETYAHVQTVIHMAIVRRNNATLATVEQQRAVWTTYLNERLTPFPTEFHPDPHNRPPSLSDISDRVRLHPAHYAPNCTIALFETLSDTLPTAVTIAYRTTARTAIVSLTRAWSLYAFGYCLNWTALQDDPLWTALPPPPYREDPLGRGCPSHPSKFWQWWMTEWDVRVLPPKDIDRSGVGRPGVLDPRRKWWLKTGWRTEAEQQRRREEVEGEERWEEKERAWFEQWEAEAGDGGRKGASGYHH